MNVIPKDLRKSNAEGVDSKQQPEFVLTGAGAGVVSKWEFCLSGRKDPDDRVVGDIWVQTEFS
jgi:hypothetical protein